MRVSRLLAYHESTVFPERMIYHICGPRHVRSGALLWRHRSPCRQALRAPAGRRTCWAANMLPTQPMLAGPASAGRVPGAPARRTRCRQRRRATWWTLTPTRCWPTAVSHRRCRCPGQSARCTPARACCARAAAGLDSGHRPPVAVTTCLWPARHRACCHRGLCKQ